MSRWPSRIKDGFLEGLVLVSIIAGAALGLVVFSWIIYIIVEWLIGVIA